MTTAANLLFSRIKGRLTYYTAELYKSHPGEGVIVENDIDGHFNTDFHVTYEMYVVDKYSNTIDPIEFYEYLDSIIEGFKAVRKKISVSDFKSVYNFPGHLLKSLQENVYNNHVFELDLILMELKSLKKRFQKQYALAKKSKELNIKSETLKIEFKEKLKAVDFKGIFDSKIKPDEAALFFHYLAEGKLIPQYSDTVIAQLALNLFGVAEQPTRKMIGQKQDLLKRKGQLHKIKTLFDSLSSAVECDMKKTK